MITKEQVAKAKALIPNPRRWLKGQYEHKGRYCLMGALGKATTDDPYQVSGSVYVETLLFDCVREAGLGDKLNDYPTVEEFNDHDETTHKDVIKVLECLYQKVPE